MVKIIKSSLVVAKDVLEKIIVRTGILNYLLRIPVIKNSLRNVYKKIFNFPKVLQIFITSQCNLRCQFCYVDSSKKYTMPKEKIYSILEEAKYIGINIVEFLGGEPFLHPDFKALLYNAVQRKFRIKIFTNGTLINDGWIIFLKEISQLTPLIIVFNFSYGKENFLAQAGEDQFDTICKNIDKCAINGLKTITFTVLTKSNFRFIEDILNFAYMHNTVPVFQRCVISKDNIDYGLKTEEYYEAIKKYRNFFIKHKDKYKIYPYTPAKLRGSICTCYRDMITINPAGDILPCPTSPLDLKIGNIYEKNLKDAWCKYLSKRDDYIFLPEKCKKCKVNDICGGGCISYKYKQTGKFDMVDPLCYKESEISVLEGLSGFGRIMPHW